MGPDLLSSWLRAFCVDFGIIFYLIFCCSVNFHVFLIYLTNILIYCLYVKQEQAGPHARPARTSSWCVACLPVVALSPADRVTRSLCFFTTVPTRVYGGYCSGGGTLAATLGRFGVVPAHVAFALFFPFVLLFTLARACRACVWCSSQSPKRALELCARETSTDWTNYKIDVVFHVPRLGARPFQQLRVDITPSASAMVLRGSSYVPPDVADRGLILATLIKGISVPLKSSAARSRFSHHSPGGYECKTRSPDERKHKCTTAGEGLVYDDDDGC